MTWSAPASDGWDPRQLDAWLDELDERKMRYCVVAGRPVDGRQPVGAWIGQTTTPIYIFADQAKTAYRRSAHTSVPFAYTPARFSELTKRSRVELLWMQTKHMNFLKDAYLQKGLMHGTGGYNFAVLLDGKLAGGFIYRFEGYSLRQLYLLADFALEPRSRISKLIAMLATCSLPVDRVAVALVQQFDEILTTAFTEKPVSMKYRGVFELVGRAPGKLNYASKIRRESPQAIYAEWWRKFAIGNAGGQGRAPKPDASPKERQVHEDGPIHATGGEP